MACSALGSGAQYRKNREKRLAECKVYRQEHTEQKRSVAAIYYANNRDKIVQRARDYYQANRSEVRRKARLYSERTKERKAKADKAYAAANKEKVALIKRRYRARLNGAAGDHTFEQLEGLRVKQRSRCANCRKRIVNYHADHIIPLVLGGSNDIFNIQLLCKSCNCSKGGKDPLIWAKTEGRLL